MYNEKGQLIKIEQPLCGADLERKELTEDVMFSSEINLSYDNSGMLEMLDYWRSSWNYGLEIAVE